MSDNPSSAAPIDRACPADGVCLSSACSDSICWKAFNTQTLTNTQTQIVTEPQPSVDHESTVRRQSAALELVKVWRGRMAGSCRMSVECEDEGFKDMDQIYANRAQVYQECADELEEALKGER